MTKGSKRLEAMRANPVSDWRMSDVESLCREYGVRCVPQARGSHYRLSHPDIPAKLTIPSRRPIKRVYIVDLVALIDELGSHT